MEFITFVDVKYMTIGRECTNGIYTCETWNMKQKAESVRCGVWKRKGGVGSIMYQVWNMKYEEVSMTNELRMHIVRTWATTLKKDNEKVYS